MKTVNVANTLIGEGEPCFIIAEAGVNHNGDINLAKRLIDVAKEAGADAVKFQTFKAEEVVTQSAEKAEYQKETTGAEESQFQMIKKLELTEEDFEELFAYALERGIIFLSSPFDRGSVDLLDGLGLPAFKIPSGEITNFPLLKRIAQKRKPIILSTGMSTLGEIEEALEVIRKEGAEEIALLHCISSYPAKVEDMNLRAMEALRYAFDLPVGLSDHTLGISIPIAAVALGATIIEKHFTPSRQMTGPDHKASLEPGELKYLVECIRNVRVALGDGIKRPSSCEVPNISVTRRSVFAAIDIPAGTNVSEQMLKCKRPGTGISPRYYDQIIGRRAKKDFKAGEILNWDGIL